MRSTVPCLSRRSVLRITTGCVAGALAAGTATACAASDPDREREPPDPLIAQAILARADAAAAQAAATVSADHAAALGVVAAERNAHADVLDAEVARAVGRYRDGSAPSSTAQPATPVAPASPLSVDQVRTRIGTAQRSAADLARIQSGYRAGLLGSISAACGAQLAVLLP
ncbi:hypothetical protein [Skermania piniformis]|uniref:hypothetical protein n=1 Tax=Skermania pinensis TaxID=39122 RepID=UPI003CCEC0EF